MKKQLISSLLEFHLDWADLDDDDEFSSPNLSKNVSRDPQSAKKKG